jgi:YggT family protein
MGLTNAVVGAIVQVVDLLLSLYVWIIIARAIISWVNPSPYHPVVRFIYRVTEPVLAPLRRIIPPIYGIDFSPIVVIFVIYLVKNILYRLFFYTLF